MSRIPAPVILYRIESGHVRGDLTRYAHRNPIDPDLGQRKRKSRPFIARVGGKA